MVRTLGAASKDTTTLSSHFGDTAPRSQVASTQVTLQQNLTIFSKMGTRKSSSGIEGQRTSVIHGVVEIESPSTGKKRERAGLVPRVKLTTPATWGV